MVNHEKIYKSVEVLSKKPALSDTEKQALYVYDFEAQVNNGGFDQFFFNSTGEFAQETLDALRAVGAIDTARLLDEAIGVWPDRSIPKAMLDRRELLIKFGDDWNPVFSRLDEEFYASNEVMAPYLGSYLGLKD